MVAKVHTVAFDGIDIQPVTVECQFLPGLPKISIVGLANKSVAESKERIRACFHALNLDIPYKTTIVNLAPADLQKEGSHYDLPIALGMMAALDIIPKEILENYIVLGEVRLNGSISSVSGVLSAALYAFENKKGIICPYDNRNEASWVQQLSILAPENIIELITHFQGNQVLTQPDPQIFNIGALEDALDMVDVKGQPIAKRALEIAAAGGHNLLMIGPPGSGKSMLAKRIIGILPPLTPREALSTTMIYSLAGQLDQTGLVTNRPFREPHHSASLPALIGGGRYVKPGEISLAHNGILFMDELPEFSRPVIDSLRQPMEAGIVTVARAENHITYPARFQLIAAMNPCRCGHYGNPSKQCHRAPNCCFDYQQKISGPIMDRFDIIVHMNRVNLSHLHKEDAEPSVTIRDRVQKARQIQEKRFPAHWEDSKINACLDGEQLRYQINLEANLHDFLEEAATKLDISARRYNRILRVARTIADLNGNDEVSKKDLLEALSYRQ